MIGADGIRSCVRALLFGDTPPHDNGRGIWRAIIPRDSCQHPVRPPEGSSRLEAVAHSTDSFPATWQLIQPGHISAVVGEGRTAIISDAGEGRLYWSYTVTDAFRKDPPGGTRSVDAEEAKRRLESDFEGWDLALHMLRVGKRWGAGGGTSGVFTLCAVFEMRRTLRHRKFWSAEC